MKDQAEISRDVRLEQFRQLQTLLPQSISIGSVLSVLVVAMLWRTERPTLLVGWLTAQLLLSWWRMATLRRFAHAGQQDPLQALRVARYIQIGCLGSGIFWGSIALFPYSPLDLQVPLFVAFVLAGGPGAGAPAPAARLVSSLALQ